MSSPGSSKPQPKVVHKLLVRTLGLLLVMAVLFGVYQWYRSKGSDPEELVVNDSAGMIAAVEFVGRGQRVVLIKEDGTIVEDQGWTEGARDRDLAWRPDGSFVYFSSDRGGKNFNLYRWNPTKASAQQLTEESRSRGNIEFPEDEVEGANLEALITTGGAVFTFHTRDKKTPQILPPGLFRASDALEEAPDTQLGGVYGRIGTSFRVARWAKGKRYIAAVMRRESGEVLILQDMQENEEGQLKPPSVLAAGDKVEFDVSPSDGSIVYAVSGFQWPDLANVPEQFREGNKITVPARHMLVKIDPDSQGFPLAMTENDTMGFGVPAISPDGSAVAIAVGPYESSGITPRALFTMPIKEGGVQSRTELVTGEIFEPDWSPDGERLVFAMREGSGPRGIYSIRKNGTDQKKLTADGRNFGMPEFSPQLQQR